MHVVVIGAGLVGLSSAWCLAAAGCKVTILDRAEGPGLETSFANGSLLTPSMADPWNAPGCWQELLRSLGKRDAPLQLRMKALPSLAGWGPAFLWNSRRRTFARSTRANLVLALSSMDAIDRICSEAAIDFGMRNNGSLRVFRDLSSLARAERAAQLIEPYGVKHTVLTSREATDFEPGLADISSGLAGAIHYPIDRNGDAYHFCRDLSDVLARRGVQLLFGEDVRSIDLAGTRVAGVETNKNRHISCDVIVAAAGSFTWPLLSSASLSVPVRPVKGYSVTIKADRPPLSIPVIDDALHAVVVPSTEGIRAAGTAEFAGFDNSIDASRVRNLVGLVRAVLPAFAFQDRQVKAWTGLRAMSADGVPLIGPSRIDGLWLNTGHGHLGWTMAAGAAQLLADLMLGRRGSVDPAPYAPRRFRV